jgi:hypothetical protein
VRKRKDAPQALNFERRWSKLLQYSTDYGKVVCSHCHRNLTEDEVSSSNPHLCIRCDRYR